MQGASGSYAVNGVELTLQPSAGRWVKRDSFGIDGHAHPVYGTVRQFELTWDLISPGDVRQIIQAFNAAGSTGTLVWDLPEYGATNFVFKSYSGTTVEEPDIQEGFMGYWQNARLVIMNITT